MFESILNLNSIRALFYSAFGLLLAITPALSSTPTRTSPTHAKYFYTVKKRENLSVVLFKLGLKPIYGTDGYLSQTLKLNQRELKNADLVYPGDIINIPLPSGFTANSCLNISENFEVTEVVSDACYNLMAQNAGRSLNYVMRRYASAEPLPQSEPLPQPVPLATPPPPLPPPQEKDVYSEITFAVYSGYSRLSGYDKSDGTSGELLSKISSGYYLDWRQLWSAQLSTHLGSSGYNLRLEDTDDSKILKNADNFLFNLHFGFDYKITPTLSLALESEYGDLPFYRGVGSGVYKVDALQQQDYGLKIQHKTLQRGPLELSPYIRAGISKFKKDGLYNPNDGSYYGYGFDLYHRRKSYGVIGKFDLSKQKTTSHDVNFEYENINLVLGLIWPWSE